MFATCEDGWCESHAGPEADVGDGCKMWCLWGTHRGQTALVVIKEAHKTLSWSMITLSSFSIEDAWGRRCRGTFCR